MSYCKHQWEDRTAVLREVFQNAPERRVHEFFVCTRCLRINEHAEHAATSGATIGGSKLRIKAA